MTRAREFIRELDKSTRYARPIGIMELVKFMNIATVEEKKEMRILVNSEGKSKKQQKIDQELAWELLQRVTGSKLS